MPAGRSERRGAGERRGENPLPLDLVEILLHEFSFWL